MLMVKITFFDNILTAVLTVIFVIFVYLMFFVLFLKKVFKCHPSTLGGKYINQYGVFVIASGPFSHH